MVGRFLWLSLLCTVLAWRREKKGVVVSADVACRIRDATGAGGGMPGIWISRSLAEKIPIHNTQAAV
jgi:hypothetical protein